MKHFHGYQHNVILLLACFVLDDLIFVYFLLSGANELAVQKAKAEITRLIKEELIRLVGEIVIIFV